MVKSKAKNIEECAVLLEIEVPKETIDKAFEEVYAEITKVATVPGFRAGKAPIELVKRHYSKDAGSEVLKRLIPDSYRIALEEHKVLPLGLPEISGVDFDEGKHLKFKAKVEIRPKFKLKTYKGIKVDKKKPEVKDEDVTKTLENLREMSATYVPVEDRPAAMGDYVVTDIDCLVDDKPIHQTRKNLWLFLDKEHVVPGLPEGVVGMKAGEEREIEVTLPEKYPDKNAAGKKAKYRVKAKEIKVRKLPDLNDDFAKGTGKDNLEDLKKEISDELKRRSEIGSSIDMENNLLNKLVEGLTFAVPESYVKRQLNLMVEDSKRRLVQKGFKKEELDKKDSEFIEKFKDDALKQVRLLFVLDEIAREEKIEVSAEDLDNAYKSISAQTDKPEEEIRSYYEREDLVDNIREKIREEKTIQFLIKNAEITEK